MTLGAIGSHLANLLTTQDKPAAKTDDPPKVDNEPIELDFTSDAPPAKPATKTDGAKDSGFKIIEETDKGEAKVKAKEEPAKKSNALSFIKGYLDPHLTGSIGYAAGDGLSGTNYGYPEMTSLINTKMPFATLGLRFGEAWKPSLYDVRGDINAPFGKRLPLFAKNDKVTFLFVPDFAFDYAKNYGISQNDHTIGLSTGLTTYANWRSWVTPDLKLDIDYGYDQRRYATAATPTGHRVSGGAELGVNLEPPTNWISLRPSVSAGGNYFNYDSESFGKGMATNGSRFSYGLQAYFKPSQLNGAEKIGHFIPTLSVAYRFTHGKQESPSFVPAVESRDGVTNMQDPVKKVDGDITGNDVSVGLHWGPEAWDSSLVYSYKNENLEGFTDVSSHRFTAATDFPSFGKVSLGLGWGHGMYHYYDIDNPFGVDLAYTSADRVSIKAGPIQMKWGVKATFNTYKDMVEPGNLKYFQAGFLGFIDASIR